VIEDSFTENIYQVYSLVKRLRATETTQPMHRSAEFQTPPKAVDLL